MRWVTSPLFFTALLALGAGSGAGCTDRNLYGSVGQEPKVPDKVTLTGVLCTDNPATRKFPVKILFLVDSSGQMRDTAPFGEHVNAMEQIISQFLPISNVYLGVIRYDNGATQLISEQQGQITSGFSRDDAQVDAALANLRNGAGARDLDSAMGLAESIITGDAFQADLGPLSRTKYVVVHVTTGAPQPTIPASRCEDYEVTPPVCEVAALERRVRSIRDTVLELGAAGLAFHTVFIEPPHVEGQPCDPRGGAAQCGGGAGIACVRTGVRIDTGRCVQLCDPANPVCDADPNRTECATTELPDGSSINYCARGELNCFDGVDNDGDGQDQDCSDPDYPYFCRGNGDCELDCRSQCRMDDLGLAMSLASGGRYERFAYSDQTSFGRIDFRSTQRVFVQKEIMAFNRNALPSENGFLADSDADGLADDQEIQLGLSPLQDDSDGDFYNDKLEHLLRTLGLDPLVPNTFPDCDDPTVDTDGDGLRDCEEKLLATDDTLFDTDADGFPDSVEFRVGTNALYDDTLDDLDLDGIGNGQEIRDHTDPRSNDAEVRASLAYRYRITDLGVTGDQRTCYDVRISNIKLVSTLDRGFGRGANLIDVYFGQVPEGSLESFGVYYVAQRRVQYVPPDLPTVNAFDLQQGDFVLFEQ